MCEMKSSLDELISRLDTAEEKTIKLEDRETETNLMYKEVEKRDAENMNRAKVTCRTLLSKHKNI
jgi:low affinity Fe/Cu permease